MCDVSIPSHFKKTNGDVIQRRLNTEFRPRKTNPVPQPFKTPLQVRQPLQRRGHHPPPPSPLIDKAMVPGDDVVEAHNTSPVSEERFPSSAQTVYENCQNYPSHRLHLFNSITFQIEVSFSEKVPVRITSLLAMYIIN
jgi:hypothetical protein